MSHDLEEISHLFKIIIIGDAGSGKTNILQRFTKNEFDASSKPTIGVEFNTKTLEIDDQLVKQQIWDTAGQERFRGVATSYYKGAYGVLLVYDITRSSTFENMVKWVDEVRNYGSSDITIVVIGNKKDLTSMREVTIEEGQEFARKYEAYFLETSAQDNSDGCIEKAFEIMTKEVLKRAPKTDMGDSNIYQGDSYGGKGYSTLSGYSTVGRSRVPNKDNKDGGGCGC